LLLSVCPQFDMARAAFLVEVLLPVIIALILARTVPDPPKPWLCISVSFEVAVSIHGVEGVD
jgi:hypothetical protein